MLDFGYRSLAYETANAPIPRQRNHHPNLERLICAAVSNARLAALLVQAPERALAQFEVGRFLTASERRLVLKIAGAQDIYEFAGRLHALLTTMQRYEIDEPATELEQSTASQEWHAAPAAIRASSVTASLPAPVFAQAG